jgi:outer membrane protein OmpA-like peptidoglycan-associated protein
MSRRTNPWPAFVDLFSALLVAAFAGFILMASEQKGAGERMSELEKKVKAYERQMQAVTRVRAEADRILKELETKLKERKLQTKVTECGEDACLDLFIHYPINQAEIPPDQQQQVSALGDACGILRDALEKFPPEQRRDIEIIVEGHADRTQAKAQDPKSAYLFNWALSSRRAASVLWEFQQCGLGAPKHSISVIGYADSEKVCSEPTEECDRQNRRTTLRLRANTQKISERLSSKGRN